MHRILVPSTILALLVATFSLAHAATEPFTFTETALPDLAYRPTIGTGTTWTHHRGRLADGRALFTSVKPDAGYNEYSILTFDPIGNTWSWKANLPGIHERHSLRLFPLSNGMVLYMSWELLTWGNDVWRVWLYDPGSDTFTAKADLTLGEFHYPGDRFSEAFQAIGLIPLSAEEVYSIPLQKCA